MPLPVCKQTRSPSLTVTYTATIIGSPEHHGHWHVTYSYTPTTATWSYRPRKEASGGRGDGGGRGGRSRGMDVTPLSTQTACEPGGLVRLQKPRRPQLRTNETFPQNEPSIIWIYHFYHFHRRVNALCINQSSSPSVSSARKWVARWRSWSIIPIWSSHRRLWWLQAAIFGLCSPSGRSGIHQGSNS